MVCSRCLAMHQNSFLPQTQASTTKTQPVPTDPELEVDDEMINAKIADVAESLDNGITPVESEGTYTTTTDFGSDTTTAPKESSFGGGIAAYNLKAIAFAIIEKHKDVLT